MILSFLINRNASRVHGSVLLFFQAYKWYELGHKRGHFASVWQRSLYNVHGLKAQPWWTPKETGYTELVKVSADLNFILMNRVFPTQSQRMLTTERNVKEEIDFTSSDICKKTAERIFILVAKNSV